MMINAAQRIAMSTQSGSVRLPALVSAKALADALGAHPPPSRALRVLDASWHMPNANRDALAEYRAGPRIPGARFFGIDTHKDHASPLPHMLPPAAQFAAACKHLAVFPETHVVVYDNAVPAIRSACRVWWTLRALGFPPAQVSVLDGGLDAWVKAGLPVDATPWTEASEADAAAQFAGESGATFEPVLQHDLVKDMSQMRALIASDAARIVDARPAGRFAGTDPEPRPGLPSGHMPTAHSVPSMTVVDERGFFKSRDELRNSVFARALDGANGKPVVATCGSGVTASVLAFALEHAGLASNVPVYDGSWTEWASSGGDIVRD
ncbi:hypothetical protein H9P43_005896 [Blastocladiella emersonii ATCC 22665]|nr:hypothetical protein H9P43_005896 [Blastocladiella emersonii ATCC 22665]